jgi:hypothetical protein
MATKIPRGVAPEMMVLKNHHIKIPPIRYKLSILKILCLSFIPYPQLLVKFYPENDDRPLVDPHLCVIEIFYGYFCIKNQKTKIKTVRLAVNFKGFQP